MQSLERYHTSSFLPAAPPLLSPICSFFLPFGSLHVFCLMFLASRLVWGGFVVALSHLSLFPVPLDPHPFCLLATMAASSWTMRAHLCLNAWESSVTSRGGGPPLPEKGPRMA